MAAGVLLIPDEIAGQVAAAAAEIEELERGVIGCCQSAGFTLEGLKPHFQEMRSRIEGR